MTRGPGSLLNRSNLLQWAALLALSAVLGGVAVFLHVPAALLVGPMIAAILVATSEGTIRLPFAPFLVAQGVIGCLVGNSIPLAILDDLGRAWPLFAAGILSVIAAASVIGYVMTLRGSLPGTTAIWGTSPGASTPMIIMSEAYGADPRLVAVMQYLRVACVIAVAALVAKVAAMLAGTQVVAAASETVWFPSFSWQSAVATTGIAGFGSLIGYWLGMPAGAMLFPMVATMVLHESGWATVALPPWILAASYALIGWSVGLRFTRPILMHAFRALPEILLCVFMLILFCMLIAVLLVLLGGIDPLTAFLATSPGGADTIAIIAASSSADMRFVVTMQMSRLIVVILVSPGISRIAARRARNRMDASD
jgi:uncharacterized protein